MVSRILGMLEQNWDAGFEVTLRYCCVLISSKTETLYPVWKILKQEYKQLQIVRKFPKLTRFTGPLPARVSNKAWESLRPKELSCKAGSQTNWESWKGHSPTCLTSCTLPSCSVLQIPSFVSCHPRWGGPWWCSCRWVFSIAVSNLSLIFL